MPTGWERLTAALAVLACGLCLGGVAAAVVRSTAPPSSAAIRDGGLASERGRPSPDAPRVGAPVRVRIPAIGVDARLDGLGLNADGTLEVPPYDRAGWYQGGPKPGDDGPAVIAAHVDSTTGPAVFYRLRFLTAGDIVTVDYDDGTAVHFVVTGADRYLKTEFPTERVYGDTDAPELRLITCGGSFDRRAGSYEENLVVWATARPDGAALTL